MTKVSKVQGLESWMLLEYDCLPTVPVCPGQVDSVNPIFADAGERLEEAKGKPGRIC